MTRGFKMLERRVVTKWPWFAEGAVGCTLCVALYAEDCERWVLFVSGKKCCALFCTLEVVEGWLYCGSAGGVGQ
jgi:hypothetical protein